MILYPKATTRISKYIVMVLQLGYIIKKNKQKALFKKRKDLFKLYML